MFYRAVEKHVGYEEPTLHSRAKLTGRNSVNTLKMNLSAYLLKYRQNAAVKNIKLFSTILLLIIVVHRNEICNRLFHARCDGPYGRIIKTGLNLYIFNNIINICVE